EGRARALVLCEGRYDGNLIDRLLSAGHEVEMTAPYASNMGHAGAVVLHPNGTLEGAHDPRADGGAAGSQQSRDEAHGGCSQGLHSAALRAMLRRMIRRAFSVAVAAFAGLFA